jgi:acyl-CoA reductase-like NAD-dependent aldehyde dehydrogenase
MTEVTTPAAGEPRHPDVRAFLATPQRLVIGESTGEPADGRTFETVNPSTGRVLAQVPYAGADDVDRAVRAAREALDGQWSRTTAAERGRLLFALADLIDAHADELAELESLDNGSTIALSEAALIPLTSAHFRHFAGWTDKIPHRWTDADSPDLSVVVAKEPVGVVAAIVPWNFPLTLSAYKLAPALAAGCTVILKPAEQSPLTGLRLSQLALEAGFPPGVFNVCTGDGATGAALVEHPGVDKVAFTGSVAVGQAIARSAADTLKRVSLELGGKSPSIVLGDADPATAAATAASAIFFNTGQLCNAGSRLFVERPIFDEVVSGIIDAAKAHTIGPATDPNVTMGPVVSSAQRDQVSRYVDRGISDGATVLHGGGRPAGLPGGYYVEPTIFADVPRDSAIAREEIFGPVLVASAFDSIESLAEVANDTPFGLAAGIFTSDVRRAHKLARAIKAGTVWINTYAATHPAVPLGGYKHSGYGRDGGLESLEQYLETKSIWTSLA